MTSTAVTRNLETRNFSAAIVAAHLEASRTRRNLDQWHAGLGPKPWNWNARPGSLREHSDPQDPNLRVTHTHTTISQDGHTLKLSGPAWLCQNCRDISVCIHCPCYHWPELEQEPQQELQQHPPQPPKRTGNSTNTLSKTPTYTLTKTLTLTLNPTPRPAPKETPDQPLWSHPLASNPTPQPKHPWAPRCGPHSETS